VLNSNDQIHIILWNYDQLKAARNYWEREKIDNYDTKLFIQLIVREFLSNVADILYSYFLNQGDEQKTMAAEEWRTRYSPQFTWKMLLSEITAPVRHINNRDNNMSTVTTGA
jgi:hypothetical protein